MIRITEALGLDATDSSLLYHRRQRIPMAPSEFRPSEASYHAACRVSEEYEAGYIARFLEVRQYLTATSNWRAGWQEADRELTAWGSAWPGESRSTGHQWSFYGGGDSARACELPFEVHQTEEWKRSWVAADIALGRTGRGGLLDKS